MSREVHVGDVGTIFRATLSDQDTVVDLSTATTLELLFLKPDGTLSTKTAVLSNAGTDGRMQYTAEVGFLDAAGRWKWQPRVEFTADIWSGDILQFTVFPNLD